MSAAVVVFTATAILPYVGVQMLGSLVPTESQEEFSSSVIFPHRA